MPEGRAEILVATNATWRFAKGTNEASAPVTLWRQRSFDDAAWPAGPTPFYFGETLTGTRLADMQNNYTCVFLRRAFVVNDVASITNLTLRAACDDGYVAWINGVEVARFNLPGNAVPLRTDVASGTTAEPIQFLAASLPWPTYLVPGTNILAIQAFNRLIGNGDFQINAELSATLVDTMPPRVAAVEPPGGSTVPGLEFVRVSFSETVTNLEAEDLLANGAPALEMTGDGITFDFRFAQPPSGAVEMSWDGGQQIADLQGNRFDSAAPGATWRYTLHDTLAPTVRSITPVPGATVPRLTQVEIIFSEPVGGVDAADLLINDRPATQVTGAGLGPFRFQFPEPAAGPIRFEWRAGHGVSDFALVPNLFAGGAWTCELNPALLNGNVVIQEFLAVNGGGRLDEDGDASDWIEILNRGSTAVPLGGWSLTDDPEVPGLWEFPAVSVPAGGYLVVFASGKDRKPVDGRPLHTSFQLAMDGEYLGLFNAASPRGVATELRPGFPEQREGISFGVTTNGTWAYSQSPTPGASNRFAPELSGIVAMPAAGVGSGFFDRPFQVTLASATAGAEVRYTLDGTAPSATRGTVYTAPLTIQGLTDRAVINLRAAAFRSGQLPSRVATFSYVFPDLVLRQPNTPPGFPTAWVTRNGATSIPGDYELDPRVIDQPAYATRARRALTAMPTLSIVLPVDDVFGRTNGIYSNPAGAGVAWERPCSAEFLFPDGRAGVKVDAGFRLQGGTSRTPTKTYKHSLRLLFKGDHGPSKLEFPLFDEGAVTRFDTLVLDAGLNLVWHHRQDSSQRLHAQYVRDQFASDLQLAMGWPAPRGRFFHLYLNGLYWGLYDVHERPDASFAAEHFGGDKSEYDSIKNTTGFEVLDGTATAWNELMALADSRLADLSHYERVRGLFDEDNFIDYMILNCWAGNTDWPHHNWYVARRQTGDTRFRFFSWDAEHVLKAIHDNRSAVDTAGSPAQLYDQLRLNSAEFRLRFADRVQRHFFNGGPYEVDARQPDWDPAHPERNRPAARYLARIAEINDAIVLESARWGDTTSNPERPGQPYERDVEWLNELGWLRDDYLPQRTGIVLNQFKNVGLYPQNAQAPTLNRSGGAVPAGFELGLSAPAGTIYYTTDGSDPRQFGTGQVAGGARVFSGPWLVLTNSLRLRARTMNVGEWSALTEADYKVGGPGLPLRITEIMYHPAGGDPYEFVELQNAGPSPIALGGFRLDGIGFVFPPDAVFASGQVVVLASELSPEAFAARYPAVAVVGWFPGSLANSGETLTLRDADGETVLSVTYDDGALWPAAADGAGASLELRAPFGDPDAPSSWRASARTGGTPGIAPEQVLPPEVRISEVMASNRSTPVPGAAAGAFPDWIELVNSGTTTADLGGWSLSDGGEFREFVFPAGASLAAGARLVVICGDAMGGGGLESGFQLAEEGESIALFDAAARRVDAITFGPQAPDMSIVRTEGGWQAAEPTPGQVNVLASTASSSSLVLNEWLADAPPGGADWLEVFNRDTTRPGSLEGLFVANRGTVFRIAVPTFVAPGGHLRLWADEEPGTDHVDFKLSAAGDALRLLAPDGVTLNEVAVSAGSAGRTEGRFPDGSEAIQLLTDLGTPGSPNRLGPTAAVRLNEILARNTSAVRDPWGGFADWLELHNPSAASFDLSGSSVRVGAGAARWAFPAGTILAPGAYLRLWCEADQPASTATSPEMNTGLRLEAEGDWVEVRSVGDVRLDALRFGPQVANLSIGYQGSSWTLLAQPTPGQLNAGAAPLGPRATLRFNEWMADHLAGSDWFELFNPAPLPVDLAGLWLGNDPSTFGRTNTQVAPLSYIAPGGFARFVADEGQPEGPNHVGFRLSALGEVLTLFSTEEGVVDEVFFGPQARGESEGRLPDGGSVVVRFPDTATPGAGNYLQMDVVIHEVLAHTDPPWEDAVELFNPGPAALDLSGWFLSDEDESLRKYRLPEGSLLPAGGFLVLYEAQFGGAGALKPFTLDSARGDRLWLSEARTDGSLTGRRALASFGASANGVSFGRVPTSVGVDFVPVERPTFGVDAPASVEAFRQGRGGPNAGPRVGPMVLNEIYFQPVFREDTNRVEVAEDEFVELINLTDAPVPLNDPAHPTNTWRLRGGVDFDFPMATHVPAGGFVVVVNFNPTNSALKEAFRIRYGLPSDANLLGPLRGRLANEGERLTLLRPDPPQGPSQPDAGFVPYVLADQVVYASRWPWPEVSEGAGDSLQRILPAAYGNDPENWLAAAPTPGRSNPRVVAPDTDQDGMPDDWERGYGLLPANPADATLDPDGDSQTNIQEFQAGTNPRDARSVLQILTAERVGEEVRLTFPRVAGRRYAVMATLRLGAGVWETVLDVPAEPSAGLATVTLAAEQARARFYRIATSPPP